MRGRTSAAAIWLVIVLAACGSTGTNTATPTTSSTSAPTTSMTTSSSSTAVPEHTPGEAAALVRRIYDPYIDATIDTPVVGNCFWRQTGRPCPIALTEIMTADLISRLSQAAHQGTGLDPVICAQNFPSRVSYDPPTRSNGQVRTVVHTFYGTASALRDHPIQVTIDLDTLRLIGLVCPPPS